MVENSGVLGEKDWLPEAGVRVPVESSLKTNTFFFLITINSALFHSRPLARSVAPAVQKETGFACRILGNFTVLSKQLVLQVFKS